MREYVYRIKDVGKVTDGDTFWVYLDVGFRQVQLTHLRLLNYDTPELYSPRSDFELHEARRAKVLTEEFLSDTFDLWVETEKDPDNFGRWLGDIYRAHDGEMIRLGEHLRFSGLASVWPTKWREEFDR